MRREASTQRVRLSAVLCENLPDTDVRKPSIFPPLNFVLIIQCPWRNYYFRPKVHAIPDGLAVDSGVQTPMLLIANANQHTADTANQAIRNFVTLSVLAQVGFILDQDYQFPVGVRYIRGGMFTTEVAITGSRTVRVWFARNFHFKRDVAAMAAAYIFMCDHIQALGA